MSTLKLLFATLAALAVALVSGLLAQTGQGATIEPELDAIWLDRNLVGADPGTELRIVEMLPCDGCSHDPGSQTATALAMDETRLIAEHLDELTVPLLHIDGPEIGYLDMAQIEQQPAATALR